MTSQTIEELVAEHDRLWDCKHDQSEVRIKHTLGGPRFKRQCLTCGRGVGEWIKKLLIPNPDFVPPWDDSIEQARNDIANSLREARLRCQQNHQSDFWEKYTAYLKSEQWQTKRRKVLECDNHLCQACLIRRAVQVHHLTYDHVFNEPCFDLVSVCLICHEELHKNSEHP